MCFRERQAQGEQELTEEGLEAALRQRNPVHLGKVIMYRDTVSTHQHGQLKRIFSHMGDLYHMSGSDAKAIDNYAAALLHTLCSDGVLLPGKAGSEARLRDLKALTAKLQGVYHRLNRQVDALVLCDGLLALMKHTRAVYCEKVAGHVDDVVVRERRKAVFGKVTDNEQVLDQTLSHLSKLGVLFAEEGDDESSRLIRAFLKKRESDSARQAERWLQQTEDCHQFSSRRIMLVLPRL